MIAKHQKQVTVNKLKKVYSTLSQFVVRTYADNGSVSDYLGTDEVVTADKTKEFFETYWFPYFNTPMVVKHLYPGDLIYDINGDSAGISVYTNYSLGRVLFSTQDGTLYNVSVMAWKKEEDNDGNIISQTALYSNQQMVYVDINGVKGPNRYGKDIFIYTINFDKNVVLPNCNSLNITMNNGCGSKGACCSEKIIKDGWQIKADYPW